MIKFGKYGRKVSGIVTIYGNYGRKVSWIVEWFWKYGRKASRIVIRFGQYGRKATIINRKLLYEWLCWTILTMLPINIM